MFTQFFCNYLLNEHILLPDQIMDGLIMMNVTRTKLGVLAMNAGYMTASQVEEVHAMQTHRNMRIGDLSVEMGFMTKEQVEELLSAQNPEYLQFGQAIIDSGYLTNSEFEQALSNYKEKYSLDKEDISDSSVAAQEILSALLKNNADWNVEEITIYLSLFINNLIRFIGKDFTLGNIETILDPDQTYVTLQGITGEIAFSSYLYANTEEMLAFAERYMSEDANEVDEYVLASTCDFLNLHNGLYTVNLSNDSGIELSLTPPENLYADQINFEGKKVFILPFIYPFGTIRLVLVK